MKPSEEEKIQAGEVWERQRIIERQWNMEREVGRQTNRQEELRTEHGAGRCHCSRGLQSVITAAWIVYGTLSKCLKMLEKITQIFL